MSVLPLDVKSILQKHNYQEVKTADPINGFIFDNGSYQIWWNGTPPHQPTEYTFFKYPTNYALKVRYLSGQSGQKLIANLKLANSADSEQALEQFLA